MEEWRDVPGFDGYQVSDFGRVRSVRRFGYKMLRPGNVPKWKSVKVGWRPHPLRAKGYLAVTINGRRMLVHILVLLAFRGPRPPGYQGCHRDDDGHNNKLENLRWDTPESNVEDYRRNSGRRERRFDRPLTPREIASAYICGTAAIL